jgi:hypothetical protein
LLAGGAVMAKEDVLRSFGLALATQSAVKDGNVLADELRRRAATFATRDRMGLVDAVREWLVSRDAVLALQAVVLVREFHLIELRDETEQVRQEVISGAFMRPSSAWIFERTLRSLA